MAEAASDAAPGTFRTEAQAVLFGFPPSPIVVRIRPRARGWRMTGALRSLGIALALAPAAAVVPPHAPWPIGMLGVGAILARRRWTERFTLMTVAGSCPKCGSPFDIKSGRLREPHPLPCEVCHHESRLHLPEGVLRAHSDEAR